MGSIKTLSVLVFLSVGTLSTYGLKLQTPSDSPDDILMFPEWEKWRWGEQNEEDEIGDGLELADVDKDQLAKNFTSCHGFTEKMIPSHYEVDDKLASRLIAHADHIYILCVECNRTLPLAWEGKVTFVPGKEIDKCLKVEQSQRAYRVTYAHKLIVSAAAQKNYDTVAILEEDFVLADSSDINEKYGLPAKPYDEPELVNFTTDGDWELLRIGWQHAGERWEVPPFQKCFPKACHCKEGTPGNVCEVSPKCDIRSSAAYMLKQSMYEKIADAWGIVDYGLLQQFSSSLVIPPLGYQPHRLRDEAAQNSWFIDSCRPEVLTHHIQVPAGGKKWR